MLTRHRFLLTFMAGVLCVGCSPSEEPDAGAGGEGASAELAVAENAYGCSEPYSFPDDLPAQTQVGADSFAWQSFLAVSAVGSDPVWKDWYTTVDLIECGQATPLPLCDDVAGQQDCCTSDGKYFPKECSAISGYADFPVIDQVGKVDDGFEEAKTQGLSTDPVIASNGTFLRYQITTSPGTYDWIKMTNGGLQQEANLANSVPVNFPCDYGTADEYSKAMSLKLAWMEMSGNLPTEAKNYYNQEMLVYTPSYRNSDGTATCEVKSMGLVGMHLVRKTTSQPAWVWATFEHNLNAPNCTEEPDSGYQDSTNFKGKGSTNTSCPATVSQDYNFDLQNCSGNACAACNTGYDPSTADALAENGQPYQQGVPLPQPGVCVNPEDAAKYEKKVKKGKNPTPPASWCLDLPPAGDYGMSTLCRQVQPSGYGYSGDTFAETEPNVACAPSSGAWSNYELISTQWATGLPDNCSANIQDQVFNTAAGNLTQPTEIKPQTPVTGWNVDDATHETTSMRSYLANTSMESYERSNCMGCHSKSTLDESGTDVTNNGTDFVYFLGLEVPAAN